MKVSAISQELIDKISKLEQELKLIEEKDSELRTYATLAPLSDDVKAKESVVLILKIHQLKI